MINFIYFFYTEIGQTNSKCKKIRLQAADTMPRQHLVWGAVLDRQREHCTCYVSPAQMKLNVDNNAQVDGTPLSAICCGIFFTYRKKDVKGIEDNPICPDKIVNIIFFWSTFI